MDSENTTAHWESENTCVAWTAQHLIEAHALSAYLTDNGIRNMIDSHDERVYDGIFTAQKGWASIRVFDSDRERAVAVIRNFFENVYQKQGNGGEETAEKDTQNAL